MPYHFEFSHSHKILLAVAEGEFNDDDQRRILLDIKAHAKALGAVAGIGDVSQVTKYAVTPAAMQQVAREESPYAPGVARYLVASSDIAFGMSRMYQLVAERQGSVPKVVRSRDEALEELGALGAVFERVSELVPAL